MGTKELAGGFLGGIGALAFSYLIEATKGRQKTLADLLDAQLTRFQAIIGGAINENELRKCKANTAAVKNMDEFRNVRSWGSPIQCIFRVSIARRAIDFP